MSNGSNTKKGVSQVPKGSEHQSDAVRARKQRRFRGAMDALGPRHTGSAAYRRLMERRGHR